MQKGALHRCILPLKYPIQMQKRNLQNKATDDKSNIGATVIWLLHQEPMMSHQNIHVFTLRKISCFTMVTFRRLGWYKSLQALLHVLSRHKDELIPEKAEGCWPIGTSYNSSSWLPFCSSVRPNFSKTLKSSNTVQLISYEISKQEFCSYQCLRLAVPPLKWRLKFLWATFFQFLRVPKDANQFWTYLIN